MSDSHVHAADGDPSCFGCKIKSVSLGFTYGKATFHGPTIKEKQERHIAEQKAAGNTIEPVGSRWV